MNKTPRGLWLRGALFTYILKLLSYYILKKCKAFRNIFDNNVEGKEAQTAGDAQAKHLEMLVKYPEASGCLLSRLPCGGVMLINYFNSAIDSKQLYTMEATVAY